MGFFNNGTGNPALGTALGVDAIQEFKVETNNFSPEYSRAGASVVNAISRSGTNEFHGSVFEYLRNSAMDAPEFLRPFPEAVLQAEPVRRFRRRGHRARQDFLLRQL